MSASTAGGDDDDSPDLVCQLDCVQGMVDALSSVRWKRHQDAVIELSEHGIVLIVEESGCLQAKVYLKRELFISYDYGAEGRPWFGLSLGLLVDCLNIFSAPGNASYKTSFWQKSSSFRSDLADSDRFTQFGSHSQKTDSDSDFSFYTRCLEERAEDFFLKHV